MPKKEEEGKKLLISPMYHNINSDKYSNDLDLFEKHLIYIKENYNIVLPEDKLKNKNICLTFDDAFYNFYYYVFPLLKKYNIKAILAVPTKYILDSTSLNCKERLDIPHDDTYSSIEKAPFCTFEELQIMSDSGLLKIASHSHNHVNLNECNNLKEELELSKKIIENKLNIICDTFIFPFGKYNNLVLNESKKYYKYLFRIGNGINNDFNGINDVIYRVNGDGLKDYKDIFSFKNMLKYKIKSFIKSF
jgi:peptidoglycan/xylan/chitin deacetylase (PgdA/CDA1 family)